MPLVRVRIYLGNKLLGEPTRPYASEVTVTAVIDRAIEPLEGIELVGTVDVFKDAGEKNRTAQLPLDCLNGVTVGELVSNDYGTNLITHVKSTAALQTPDGMSNARLQRSNAGLQTSLRARSKHLLRLGRSCCCRCQLACMLCVALIV